jgi:serine/threonine-protein kinase
MPLETRELLETRSSPGQRQPRRTVPSSVLSQLEGRFQLEGVLGQGGMGVVYQAVERASGRAVALKLLHAKQLTDRARRRFQREGEITASLKHPGILKIHSCGEVAGVPYLAYELVPGARPLDEAAADLDLRARVELVRDAARALGHAHAAGVVHRDVKPENLLVGADGRLRVADFGLAAAAGLERLTQTGAALGTPYYMSPEHFTGERERVGPAADVWSLGVCFYELLCGRRPFDGPTFFELRRAIERGTPPPPESESDHGAGQDVPRELATVCLAALRPAPSERYADGEALAEALDGWLEGRAVSAPRREVRLGPVVSVAVSGLALLALAASAVWAFGGAGPEPAGEAAATEREVTLQDLPGGAAAAPTAGARPTAAHEPDPGAQAPRWFRRLEAHARPPLPLPQAVDWGPRRGEYLHRSTGAILVWVAPGAFTMGSDPADPAAEEDERPAHRVRIERGFFLGKTEVTEGAFARFAKERGRTRPPSQFPVAQPAQHPATQVTWNEAVAYCSWAGLRLPTEAEWEWAARGPDVRAHPWGDEAPAAWHCNRGGLEDGHEVTAPVGQFPDGAAPCGALDMAGNVWEWVQDRHGAYPAAEQIDPTGPKTGLDRVHRGGGWNSSAGSCRATQRARAAPDYTNVAVGFRVALSHPARD